MVKTNIKSYTPPRRSNEEPEHEEPEVASKNTALKEKNPSKKHQTLRLKDLWLIYLWLRDLWLKDLWLKIMKTMKKLHNWKKGKEMVAEADADPKESDEEPIQSKGEKER